MRVFWLGQRVPNDFSSGTNDPPAKSNPVEILFLKCYQGIMGPNGASNAQNAEQSKRQTSTSYRSLADCNGQ